MSSYSRECKLCYTQIEMNDRTGKWLPYSVTTGKLHQCAKPKYDRKKLYELSISHIGDIPQLEEPTDEQKQWVLNRLRGPARSWERWNQ